MKWKFSILTKTLLLGMFLLTASPSQAEHNPATNVSLESSVDQERSASKLLEQYPEISVVFTHAPGNGHYASTRLVMDRLRELGYKGKFNIYIDPYIKEKIYHFLPGFDPKGESNQILHSLHAETHDLEVDFKKWKTLDNETTAQEVANKGLNKPIHRFAIMGGDDYRIPPSAVNADALLVVQPSGWKTPELRITNTKSTNPEEYLRVYFKDEERLKLKDVIPNPASPTAFMDSHMRGNEALEKKIPGLQKLAKVIDEHEVLTAYGISFQEGEKKLAGILSAINRIQDEGAIALKKGLVVPMISNFNEGEWETFYQKLPKKVLSRTKVVSILDHNLSESFHALKSNEILIVKTGSVSQDVWNYLMSKSTFPPMASGTTGGNYLGKLGKPFINTIGYGSGTGKKTYPYIKMLSEALAAENVPAIEKYLVDARDPHSEMSTEFRQYAEEYTNGKEKVEALFEKMGTDQCLMNILKSTVPEPPKAAQGRKYFRGLVDLLSSP